MCIFFIPRLSRCEKEEIFDSESLTCTSGNISSCPSSTEPPPIEITTPSDINLTQICEGVFFAARPHPSSSFLFVGCIRGEGMIKSCLNGEFFDADLLECRLTSEICTVPSDVCQGIELDIIVSPCTCYQYYVCYMDEISVEGTCEEDYIFDVQNKR